MIRYLLERASSAMFGVAAFVCYPAILVIIAIDVVRRYVFNSPWTWSQEFASLMLFLALALSAPAAWLAGVHIRAEFVRANVSMAAKARIERVVWLLVIFASTALAFQCWKDGKMMILFNENSPELDLPHVWFRGALGVSAVVTGLVGLWGLVTGYVADAESDVPEELIE